MEAPCNYANPLGVGATMQSHSSLAISQNKQWDFKNLKNTQWEPEKKYFSKSKARKVYCTLIPRLIIHHSVDFLWFDISK